MKGGTRGTGPRSGVWREGNCFKRGGVGWTSIGVDGSDSVWTAADGGPRCVGVISHCCLFLPIFTGVREARSGKTASVVVEGTEKAAADWPDSINTSLVSHAVPIRTKDQNAPQRADAPPRLQPVAVWEASERGRGVTLSETVCVTKGGGTFPGLELRGLPPSLMHPWGGVPPPGGLLRR